MGCTFDLLFLSLCIDAGMRAALFAARPAHRRRRWAKRHRTAHAVIAVCCDPGAMLEQIWSRTGVLPSALLEVARFDSSLDRVRVPSGSALQQHARGAPNHLLPVRVGHTAYVRRGGADGAAGALNGHCWRWLAPRPAARSRGTLRWPGEHARARQGACIPTEVRSLYLFCEILN